MFSISKKIYGWFNRDDISEKIAGVSILFFVGCILYLCLILSLPKELGWFGPYKYVLMWMVPILTFIFIEWLYIDACINYKEGNWNGYFPEKLLSILTGIYLTISTLSGIMCVIGIMVLLETWIIKLINWMESNLHTLMIIFIVIGIIVAYFGINNLIGRYIRKKK